MCKQCRKIISYPIWITNYKTYNKVTWCLSVGLYQRISLTTEQIWFSFTKYLFIDHGKIYINIGEDNYYIQSLYKINRICVSLYQSILLTAEPIWFALAIHILIGSEKVYNYLGEGTTTLPRGNTPRKNKTF